MAKLKDEIQQTRPFQSLQEEVFLNILRTAESVSYRVHSVLRDQGLSPSQYNVLRILRGAGADGLACRQIADRMVSRDSDMTRLIDGLEKREFVVRNRSERDRRVIQVSLTTLGQTLVNELDSPLKERLEKTFDNVGADALRELVHTLEAIRG